MADEEPVVDDVDVVVVGAGFAGMYALHVLRGRGLSVRGFERASNVGGTWWWNRYPGARCDIESLDYSYSFDEHLQQEWEWSERYAAQPEILRYANHVADRFDLRRDITFDTKVTDLTWDERMLRWTVASDRGHRLSARFCVMAVGPLSAPKRPEIEGFDRFPGEHYFTSRWPHEGVDVSGQRVGVIGTGSSAIQSIPILAQHAAHLTVFQRTPNFTMPAKNGPLDRELEAERKADYAEHRRRARWSRSGLVFERSQTPALSVSDDEREATFEAAWESGLLHAMSASYSDLLLDDAANETAAEFARRRIREIVADPAVAELLCPRDHPFGTKRPCLDTNYFETYNRTNVTLVDVRNAPIVELTERGLRTTNSNYELDTIVFATGFDALTGPLLDPLITGAGGITLREKWAGGPRTYLGLMSAGFPNLFTVVGPQSPSVMVNMIPAIEQHVDWIADCITYLGEHGIAAIDPTSEHEERWGAQVMAFADRTLFPKANSWWMGANVRGKPRGFMMFIGGLDVYRTICDDVAAAGYAGFTLTPSEAGVR